MIEGNGDPGSPHFPGSVCYVSLRVQLLQFWLWQSAVFKRVLDSRFRQMQLPNDIRD